MRDEILIGWFYIMSHFYRTIVLFYFVMNIELNWGSQEIMWFLFVIHYFCFYLFIFKQWWPLAAISRLAKVPRFKKVNTLWMTPFYKQVDKLMKNLKLMDSAYSLFSLDIIYWIIWALKIQQRTIEIRKKYFLIF